ncbi:MAG: M3 family metallopeptidase [Nanoarchaeota archaeon]|nr:M3 family metallopeptidase [Nanoarchaeota archaeon]
MLETQLKTFIDSHVLKIKPLSKDANIAYFNAITTGKPEYYKEYEELALEIEKIYNNKEEFEIVKSYRKNINNIKDQKLKRQIIILYNSYLGSQGDINLIKKIVELSSKIEKEFNRFRAKINKKEYTDNEIKEILKKENSSSLLQQAWEASKKQGEIIEKDLIELVKLRNNLAKSLGFENYYEMSLELSEQNKNDIIKLFDELDKLTKQPFEKLKKEVDGILKKRYDIKELKPWHYHDLFFQEAPEIYKVDLDKYYEKLDVIKITEDFYKNLALPIDDVLKRSDLYEKPNKYQHACCMDIDREGDIRIVENVKNNERWMDTTLHELGHAVYDKYIDKDLPFLLRHAAHIFTTEAIALLFGRFATNPDFIEKYSKMSKKKKKIEDLNKIIKLQKLVFSRWSQVMLNFEKALYENPSQNLNKLWWDLAKKYQLLDFYRDKPDWASKIHFTTSPVYYHNYLMGDLLSSQIKFHVNNNILNKDKTWISNAKVGDFLKKFVFSPGKLYEWNEMIKRATGEYLTPKYFVEEFCSDNKFSIA